MPAKPLPGAENAGKPGYYTVKPGDTLIRIGLDTGQNWRDLARWNNLDNPNVHRGRPGAARRRRRAPIRPRPTTRPVPSTRVETRPLDARRRRPRRACGSAGAARRASAGAGAGAGASACAPRRRRRATATTKWPGPGPPAAPSSAPFDEARSKGLVIAGKAGDPVLAAADGRVVYAGSGLRGYGNLVILKHNNTYLTAYAHNQTLLVKEDQTVRRGQKIAEMGSTDAERVQAALRDPAAGQAGRSGRLLPPR